MSNEHRAENPVQNISNVVISAGGTYNVSLLRTRVAPSNLWQNKRTHYYTADHTHTTLSLHTLLCHHTHYLSAHTH